MGRGLSKEVYDNITAKLRMVLSIRIVTFMRKDKNLISKDVESQVLQRIESTQYEDNMILQKIQIKSLKLFNVILTINKNLELE